MDETAAFLAGYKAYGKFGVENPYPPESKEFDEWVNGNAEAWMDNFI